MTVFNAARRLPPEGRAAYLDEACAAEPALRQRIVELLQASEAAGPFLENPARGAQLSSPTAAPPGPGGTIRVNVLPAEKLGDRVGRYKILQQIGEGGCGAVYLAEQEEPVRRRVALKVIKLGMDTRQVIARFEAERQALALMDHPHIAKVLEAGATDTGRPYFVMELVRGIKITDYCDQNNLSTTARLELFIQVCHAIQHAHQKGIIHRDIKPSNVLAADHDGVPVPKIIDFGIAKATSDQRLTDKTLFTALEQFIGTPAYMSPEQAMLSGLDIDTRSDIYSLGVLLYELLTGKTPFEATRLHDAGLDEIRRIIRDEEPPRPSTRLDTLKAVEKTTVAKHRQSDAPRLVHLLRGDLDWIVMKALEKDRTRRYVTANDLAMDVQRYLSHEAIAARPPSNLYKFQKLVDRHKRAFAAAVVISTVLLATTTISVWQAILARQRLVESQAMSKFLTEAFQSPDPARDSRTITVAEALAAAARKLETDLASQPARRATLQGTVAETYHRLGLDREAIPLEEKARDYLLATSGLENTNTIQAMHNLALFYQGTGRRAEALKLQEQVLPLSRKVNGPKNTATLSAMNNLSFSYEEAGRNGEALKLREEVLDVLRKVTGPESPATLRAMNNLAIAYDDLGRLSEALKLREETSALYRKVCGEENTDTLLALLCLATSYEEAGRRAEALKLQQEVVEVRRRVSGPEHPDTLWAMNNLAISYYEEGRFDEALKLREQVLALRRKVLGAEHINTLWAMHNLATSYFQARRFDEALNMREELLALSRKINGPEHPATLAAMHNLAISYEAAGRRGEALKLREEVLELYQKIDGPEHPDTLDAMKNLAISYDSAHRQDEALKCREQVLALDVKVLGGEHPTTLDAMRDLAVSYVEANRWDEALKLREQSLALSRKVLGPAHRDTINAVNELADCYGFAGRDKEAISLLAQACVADPKDAKATLRLATWQTWYGLDADYEATRRRAVQQAEGTDQAATADCAADACCMRDSTDATMLAKALDLARRSVELGHADPLLPYYQIGLGIAEYRNRQYADAERDLSIGEKTIGDAPEVIGTARLFRAMSLFQHGQPDEAKRLCSQTEATMPPLPADARKPQDSGRADASSMIEWWLAYKEAKALIANPSTP